MKKLHTVFRRTSAALIAALSLLAASCSNLLDGKPPAHADPAGGAYGTLRINSGSGRALLLEEITGAEITVSGEKMSDIKAKSDASNGKGGAVIEKIPVGKNRVVTVAAERTVDNILKKMDGVVMRAATDIESGENTVSVTWETTAVGNVFAELLEAESFDSSAVAPEAVEALVPSGVHASLVDAAKIAADIRSGTPGTPERYRLEAGSVRYTADAANGGATVQVCDPLSERQQGLAAGTSTIETVAPGTWNFYVIIDGTIFFQTEITVESGKPTDIGEITLKTPAPRLEAKDGTALTDLLQRGAAGEMRTVYLACRTMDGEPEPDGVSIYYTTDGSKPTASSARYTAAGISIPADKAVTIKAFAVKAGFAASETETYEFIMPQLGFTYPSDGPFSPVDENGAEDGFGWSFDSEPGALISGSTATFTVYSANAERILLEIYDKNYGEDAAYDYWMEKGGDNFWRAKLNGVEAGTLYAFRAWGPNWTYSDGWTRGGSGEGFSADYDNAGNRFNPNKVLFDPYAREISHDKSNPAALGAMDGGMYGTGGEAYKGAARRNFDTGRYAPKSVVVDDGTGFGTKPKIAQKDAIIYEAHVRGLTRHSSSASLSSILRGIDGFEGVADIPADKQGTYAGAALMAPYLKALGVNTIELLPVHETDNDANPDDAPGGNFWGYMTYGYFAPDRRYASDKSYGGPTKEFKEMVAAFHAAGIEVYLDVVFNHSGEGGTWYGDKDDFQTSELTFMRGLDNSTYYALTANSKSYWETTGCGNNLQCDNPIVRKLILDSLTYWLDDMGVDGFRFDLAPVLGREKSGDEWVFSASAKTITDIAALGASRNAEMIAEAWDTQWPGGYQVGNFPSGWGEWNGRFRDAIRSYVGTGSRGALNDYINGDYNNFNDQGGPHKSVNFVVAHDGFTLADLCSYQGAGNALNSTLEWPFGPSDGGNGDYNTLGFGTEPANKRQAARNYIALQMMSRGVPMIVYGDELCRTQNGNNNPYNVDSVATWNNYAMINTASPHTASTGGSGTYHNNFGTFGNEQDVNGNFMFMKYMLNLRKNEPALRQSSYDIPYDFKKEDGASTLSDGDKCVWLRINGSKVSGGSDYLVFMNMSTGRVNFTVPAAASGMQWRAVANTESYFESTFNYWEDGDASAISE
ncbi:MAG: chitobiase/beta-hexosaminidase C-terminal domain-containing protein [Treponemataceae bacterium]|nr:chitobiase/beta-hexosaminidase C-terminal domain-containing protein [Treponemataceae bacterium]